MYEWWKKLPDKLRRPFVFVVGMLLILLSPIIGSVPGPGGIIVFLGGIAILASEFDWAENLKAVILEKVPTELKKRWQPTPRWQIVFDITSLGLLALAIMFFVQGIYLPVLSMTAASVAIALFNRNRLQRIKNRLKH